MKKTLLALAVLAASGAALAQSSVTLYGVADGGMTIIDGDKTWHGMTSGGHATSRLGLRGSEDLGAGLKATFRLEGAINIDTGDGASSYTGAKAGDGFSFRRHSTVGLQGDFGEVRFGRELTAAYNALGRYDPFGSTGIGASGLWGNGGVGDAGINQGARTTDQRISNAITYITPNFSGFKVAANYGFGEVTGKNSEGRYLDMGATYDNGPISVGLSAERLTREEVIGSGSGDITTWSTGGSYDFGAAKLRLGYRQSKVDDYLGALGNDVKRKGFMVGVSAPVGPGLIRASYNHYRDEEDGVKDAKADHVSVGYIYSLSKRTSLYGTYSYLKNKDKGNRFSLSRSTGLDEGKQHGLQFGLSHSF